MHDEGTDSKIKVFANIFISFIGAGILGLPYAFREAGLIEGILIMSVVGIVSVKAMLLLIDCKDHMLLTQSLATLNDGAEESKRKEGGFIDYGDVGERALGTSGKVVVEIMIVISQIGFCCAYLIFISENLHSILPRLPKIAYLISLLIPLVFLTNLRSLNHLAPFSLAADFANIFAYGIVFYFDMDHFHLLQFHITNFSLEGFPFFLGIAIYCFEGAGLIMSLEASTAKEIRSSFRSIFKLAIISTTTLYLLFGICGYLSFGPETNSIITLNLPVGLFPFVVKGCLCFSLFFTYPIMLFPVTNILERLLCTKTGNDKDYYLGLVLRTALVAITGLIVLAIPNFSTLMALVGCSCCMFLAFILPGIFHWLIFRDNLTMWGRIMDLFLIVVGIVGGHPDQEFARYIVEGIRSGFRIGFDGTRCKPRSATKNMQNPQPVHEYLNTEQIVEVGDEVKKLVVSPFGLIPKKDQPGNWKLIQNLCHPDEKSGISRELSSLT